MLHCFENGRFASYTSSEVYLLHHSPEGKANNVPNLRYVFVGCDVLGAPHKNDVTLFPNTSSTTGATPAVPLPQGEG